MGNRGASILTAPNIRVNTCPQKKRPDAGLTLVEVMMGAVVLAAVLVGMMHAITAGWQMLDLARKQTVASQIIRFEIEKVHQNEWALVNAYSTSTAGTALTVDTSFSSVATGFTLKRTVTAVRTELLKITFTVAWQSGSGRSYARSGSTYVGKNGLYVTYTRP